MDCQLNINTNAPAFKDIDYNIGDMIVSKDRPNIEIGICTGFRHNDSCVDIDGRCYGGRIHFMKSEWTDYVIVD